MKAPTPGETPPARPEADPRDLEDWDEFIAAFPHYREKCGHYKTDKEIEFQSVRDEYATWLSARRQAA